MTGPTLSELGNVIPEAFRATLLRQLQTHPAFGPPPTPEYLAEREQRKADRRAAETRVLNAIADVEDPALRAVLDLHKKDGAECHGCDPGSYAESDAWWPCSTIQALAPFIGVEVSDLNLL